MRTILFSAMEASLAAIFLLPLLAWVRKGRGWQRSRFWLYAAFCVYLAAMYHLVGLPDVTYVRWDPVLNLVPFRYMFSDYRSSLLNLALFLPLGFFARILWKPFERPVSALALGLGLSAFIELFQLFTLRATDVNDLMTNTLGTLLGWCLGCLTGRVFPAPREEAGDLWLLLPMTFGVCFFLQPWLSHLIWALILG